MNGYKIQTYFRHNLMQPAVIIGFWCTICVLLFSGCNQQQGISTVGQINVPNLSKAHAIQTVEDVLSDMHFEIDKADTDAGYVRTRPLAGAQFFEFWRSDSVGEDNWIMNNLHNMRRTVEIEVSRNNEQLQIDCNVHVQRLSLPEPEMTSTGQTYRMFSRSKPTMQRLTLNPKLQKGMTWVDLDDDKQLATEILKRIDQRINKNAIKSSSQANDETTATGNKT